MPITPDGGRGSLKSVMQIRYKDDPLLKDDVSDGEIKKWRNSDEHLDGGVNRTFVLSKIPRVGESTYTVHYQHNQLNFEEFFDFCTKHKIKIYFLGDMKMGNHLMNLGTHSSFTCQEHKERTIKSCIEQAKLRENDRLKGKEKSDKDYFNVQGMPINLLVYISKVCPDRSLLDIFPGGPCITCLV